MLMTMRTGSYSIEAISISSDLLVALKLHLFGILQPFYTR